MKNKVVPLQPQQESLTHSESRRRFIATGIGGLALYAVNGFTRPAYIDPRKLRFSKNHLWLRAKDDSWIVGITNYVQSSLGRIKCINLPGRNADLSLNDKFGSLAAVAIFDLLAPVSGKIIRLNEAINAHPEWLNEDPYDKGWLVQIQLHHVGELRQLLTISSYEQFIKLDPKLKLHRDVASASDGDTYVVTESCVNCKYTDCAAVCPVEAFHELPDRLYINSATCISCDACLPECPIEAIFDTQSLPKEYEKWIALNREAVNYPVICQKQTALHTAACVGPSDKP